VIALADPRDDNGDGISGRVQLARDTITGDTRLGRFGWKAGTSSLTHQVAAALNTDMGVMTSLGVRPRRALDDATAMHGETLFEQIGCAGCHVSELRTSAYHPFAELRDQVIHPYTALLLHDLGEGLADSLDEGEASGAEWRTTPLWGIGLSACVTGGVEGPFQSQVCTPDASYLHDGRARTLEEAILWHGGYPFAYAKLVGIDSGANTPSGNDDVRGIVMVQAEQLDQAYLRRWARRLGVTDLLERALPPIESTL
jgi:CxxC motif-containing protein (DUF1111 family)